jgi:aldose 1-epimerase
MCVDPQGGSLLSLVSLQHQQAILREGHGQQPGDCGLFPMLPVANRVAGNRFMLRGEEVVLPQHGADDTFFLHGDGWLQRWQIITATQRLFAAVAQLAPCGYDYTARLCYQLETSSLHASLTLTIAVSSQ